MTATAARPLPRTRSLTPQCVTLPLSEIAAGDRRLDAEVYLSDGFSVRRAIRDSLLAVSPLGQLARIWQPSRLKGIRVDREHGAPFLAATQAFDIWPTPRKWLAPSKTPSIADRYVSPGWILVTCSGTVGTVILTYSAHADKVISHDLLRVEVEDPSLRSYVYTFLRTRFGRTMMRGTHYGTSSSTSRCLILNRSRCPCCLDCATRSTTESALYSPLATKRTDSTWPRGYGSRRQCATNPKCRRKGATPFRLQASSKDGGGSKPSRTVRPHSW